MCGVVPHFFFFFFYNFGYEKVYLPLYKVQMDSFMSGDRIHIVYNYHESYWSRIIMNHIVIDSKLFLENVFCDTFFCAYWIYQKPGC